MSDTSGIRTIKWVVKKAIVSKGLRSRDMVVSYPALSPRFHHFREERPPKWRNRGDGSGMRLEIWRGNSEKVNMRLILFPRMTKSRSMAGFKREVSSPAFYSSSASPWCGV